MRYISVALAALALLLSYPARTQAYCLNMVKGKSLAWKTMPVSYRVSGNLKDAAVLAAIHKAFATWGSVGCSELAFKKAGTFSLCSDAACLAFGKTKGTIDVYWFTGKSDLFKNTSNPGSPYATFAHPIYDKASAIVGASIGVNAFDFKWKTTGAGGFLDVQNEMTALVGGVIGLADSGIKGTTMSGKITYGETAKRTLAQDDIDGVRHLYLSKGCPAPPKPGSNGCSKGTPVGDGPPPKLDAGPAADGPVADGPQKPAEGGADKPPTADGPTSGSEASTADSKPGQCTATSQCSPGSICSAEGQCVKIGGDDEDGGCGCRVGRGDAGGLALLGLVGLLWCRRRRLP